MQARPFPYRRINVVGTSASGKTTFARALAARLDIPAQDLYAYGPHMAKVRLGEPDAKRGKLILVTGVTPTKSGEGKTVTCIGLAQALDRLGKRVVATLRQPSLGPVR